MSCPDSSISPSHGELRSYGFVDRSDPSPTFRFPRIHFDISCSSTFSMPSGISGVLYTGRIGEIGVPSI
jgi:hypothetical protein